MPTLLLVDGSSYLYRAFHALPDLRNAKGEPTGAIRGVLSMLRRLESDYKAEFRACIFDAKGKTFRDDWYPEYKSHRPPMPDDLRAQIEPLHEAVQAEGWPLLSIEGVEADDVIGTLTRQALERGWEVVISTGDKDLTQLVRPGVKWVNTMNEEVLDVAGVEAKFGVPPERIVDYLALVGDTVDNVPGVEKCGPKTAVKWLAQFGDLDGLIANADKVGGKVGENLRKHLEFLPLGRKLVTVVTDLELPVKLEELPAREDDKAALRALYERFEFRSWLKDLDGGEAASVDASKAATENRRFGAAPTESDEADPPGEPGAHRGGYLTILDWPAFDAWLARISAAELTAFDTETTSLDPMAAQLVGISFAVEAGEAAYLPLAHRGAEAPEQLPLAEVLDKLRPWLESDAHAKLGQNLKYDAHVLANHGITLRGIAHDTLLESYVLESDKSHDMDSLARRHLGLTTLPYAEVCGKGAKQIGFFDVAVERATEYAAEDADVTLRLHQHLWPQLEAEPRLAALYRDIELPVLSVLQQMERTGVLIDPFLLAQHSEELGRRLHALERRPTNWPASPSTSVRPSSSARSCSASSACRWSRRPPPASPPPTKKCWKSSPRTTRCPSCCSSIAACPSSRAPTPTSCRAWSTPPPAGCTPASRRPPRSPAGCPAPNPTCRTSRSARPRAAASAPPSSRRATTSSSPPTTRRSSCASWPTCRATPACSRPSPTARTCTAPPPARSSACRRTKSAANSAATPRSSTSASSTA